MKSLSKIFCCQHIPSFSVVICLTCIQSFAGSKDAPTKQPNLIILLADDMGINDPSCFGGTAVKTPNLDRLAAEGIRFSNFYAASAVCSPTRASVMTGRYPLRFGIRGHLHDDEGHLSRQAVTLPQLLKQNGYATAHVGKWHLGGLHKKHAANRTVSIPGPHEHGLDHYLCQNEEQGSRRDQLGRTSQIYRKGGTILLRDEQVVGKDDPYYNMHFTDINGAESIRLIEQFHKDGKPFYLNLWWLVPHTPYEPAPEPYWSQTAAKGISENQHRFRSMVAHMDARIGEVLDKLEELGLRDNTLILFASDNGGAYEADIGEYKGGKTDLHDGGLRVPMVASWPARIAPGQTTDLFGHSTDILPTFCDAAGITPPDNIDGINLLPHMLDTNTVPERGTVFWQINLYRHLQRHYPKPKPYSKEIARDGDWKLLCFDGEPRELFNIKSDPLEKQNLLSAHPEIAKNLKGKLKIWLAEPRLSPYLKNSQNLK